MLPRDVKFDWTVEFWNLYFYEFRRILIEKDAKNTRRATNGAVKIFRTYLKAKNMPEMFENFTNEEFAERRKI
jgi:hypothetical protein